MAKLLLKSGRTIVSIDLQNNYLKCYITIVQSVLRSNFAIIPQFLVMGRFFNQIQVDV